MSLLTPTSAPAILSELAFFDVAPTNVSTRDGSNTEIYPISSVLNSVNSPIEFHIESKNNYYLDLSKTKLYIKCKIQKGDGDLDYDSSDLYNPAKTSGVSLVNNSLHSFFSNVEVYLNDILITTPSTNSYAYSAYLKKLLTTPLSVKESRDTSAGFYFDTNNTDLATNKGFKSRHSLSANNKTVEFFDSLYIPIFNQNKYLLSGCKLRLRFNRTPQNFVLQKLTTDTVDNYNVKILEIKLLMRQILIEPSIVSAHEKLLSKQPAMYQLDNLTLKTFSLTKGSSSFLTENIFPGKLPSKIVFGLVNASDFHGSFSNPFNFRHHNISTMRFFIDNIPIEHIETNIANNVFIENLQKLYLNLGFWGFEEGDIGINRENFLKGNFLFCVDLSADHNESDHLDLVKSGNSRLFLKFASKLDTEVMLVILAVFPSLIKIDGFRRVSHDFLV